MAIQQRTSEFEGNRENYLKRAGLESLRGTLADDMVDILASRFFDSRIKVTAEDEQTALVLKAVEIFNTLNSRENGDAWGIESDFDLLLDFTSRIKNQDSVYKNVDAVLDTVILAAPHGIYATLAAFKLLNRFLNSQPSEGMAASAESIREYGTALVENIISLPILRFGCDVRFSLPVTFSSLEDNIQMLKVAGSHLAILGDRETQNEGESPRFFLSEVGLLYRVLGEVALDEKVAGLLKEDIFGNDEPINHSMPKILLLKDIIRLLHDRPKIEELQNILSKVNRWVSDLARGGMNPSILGDYAFVYRDAGPASEYETPIASSQQLLNYGDKVVEKCLETQSRSESDTRALLRIILDVNKSIGFHFRSRAPQNDLFSHMCDSPEIADRIDTAIRNSIEFNQTSRREWTSIELPFMKVSEFPSKEQIESVILDENKYAMQLRAFCDQWARGSDLKDSNTVMLHQECDGLSTLLNGLDRANVTIEGTLDQVSKTILAGFITGMKYGIPPSALVERGQLVQKCVEPSKSFISLKELGSAFYRAFEDAKSSLDTSGYTIKSSLPSLDTMLNY